VIRAAFPIDATPPPRSRSHRRYKRKPLNRATSPTHLTARANIHVRAVIHETDDRLEVALGARLVQLRQSAKGVVIVHPHLSRVVVVEESFVLCDSLA